MARIALVTCAELPDGDVDDAPLPALLDAEFRVWDDPAVDWGAYELVVVCSPWDYHDRLEAFLAWADGVERLHNPADVLRWNTDKRYLEQVPGAIQTAFVAPGEPFAQPDVEHVVKPTVSAGSRLTARFDPGDARAQRLVDDIHAAGKTAMVQPYVPSVDARGETALMYFGGTFSHAIRKGPILGRGAEPTTALFAAEDVSAREATARERELADAVVAALPWELLYARIDLVADDDGTVRVLEVELTEPSLFFGHAPGAAERYVEAVKDLL